jgi:tRNA1(Val) A37 N6-methylase TrmN6
MNAPVELIRERLEAAREPGEIITPILPPENWTSQDADRTWPAILRAGVIESKRGYRFRPENCAWVQLIRDETAASVVDLGAGNGSLLLAAIAVLAPKIAVAVEVQPAVANRLRRTLGAHGCVAPVVAADIRDPDAATAVKRASGLADLVVTNPPFYPEGWGRPSKNPEVHASTHCLHGDVRNFLQCAEAILAPNGIVWLVYDAIRLAEALAAAGAVGLGMDRMVWIPDTRAGRQHIPTRVWLRLRRGASPIHAMR